MARCGFGVPLSLYALSVPPLRIFRVAVSPVTNLKLVTKVTYGKPHERSRNDSTAVDKAIRHNVYDLAKCYSALQQVVAAASILVQREQQMEAI